jgi:hypothetical protein
MAMLIGGAFSVLGNTLLHVGQALSPAVATGDSAARLSLSAADLRREIESVLRASERSELPSEEVQGYAGGANITPRKPDPLSRITDQSLAEVRDRLSALDRETAVNFMVNHYGMSDAQARDVVQSTIGLLGPVHDTLQSVKHRSRSFQAESLDRLGMIALWLSGLALISLVVSAIGGMFGTPKDRLLESTNRTEWSPDIRRAG